MQAMCPNALMHAGLHGMDGAPDTKAARSCLRPETSCSAARCVGYEHNHSTPPARPGARTSRVCNGVGGLPSLRQTRRECFGIETPIHFRNMGGPMTPPHERNSRLENRGDSVWGQRLYRGNPLQLFRTLSDNSGDQRLPPVQNCLIATGHWRLPRGEGLYAKSQRRSLLLNVAANHQHRLVGFANDAFSHTAKHQVFEPTPAMRAKHNQVSAGLVGLRHNRRGDLPRHNGFFQQLG